MTHFSQLKSLPDHFKDFKSWTGKIKDSKDYQGQLLVRQNLQDLQVLLQYLPVHGNFVEIFLNFIIFACYHFWGYGNRTKEIELMEMDYHAENF